MGVGLYSALPVAAVLRTDKIIMNVDSLHDGQETTTTHSLLPSSFLQQQPHSAAAVGAPLHSQTVADDDDDADDGHPMQAATPEDNAPEQDEVDRRSIYVGNVDYGATPPELQEHFKNCGAINRITIMVDKYTGHPKGYAYIEFQEESAIPSAVSLNESSFRDRPLKVTAKRKNVPGYSRSARGGKLGRGESRGGRGISMMRGRGRGIRGGTFPGYFPRYRGRGGRAAVPFGVPY